MAEIVFYVLVLIIAAIIRYMLGVSQACLYVRRTIAEVEIGTGLQDAVTPPMASNIALTTWAIAIVLLGYGFWQFGMMTGIIALGLLILTTIVAGAIAVPKPNSKHFVQIIYHSLVNRVANYTKANNHMRSEAAAELVKGIEHHFIDKLR